MIKANLIGAAGLVLLLGGTLGTAAACDSGPAPKPNGGNTSIGLHDPGDHFWQDLGDGTNIECWFISVDWGSQAGLGGPSCDWVAYHQAHDKRP